MPMKYPCADVKMPKTDEMTYCNIQAVPKKSPNHIYSNVNTYNNLPSFADLDHTELLGTQSTYFK